NLLPDFSKYTYRYEILGSEIEFDLLNGPILAEHSKRLKMLQLADSVIAEGNRLTKNSVIITGEAYPLIDIKLPYNKKGKVIYEYFLDSVKVKYYSRENYDIYYLPDQEKENMKLYNVNLKDNGGKNLFSR